MELTEVRIYAARPGGPLGFEAPGPADLLRSELEATAALVFAQALPGWRATRRRRLQVLRGVAALADGRRK